MQLKLPANMSLNGEREAIILTTREGAGAQVKIAVRLRESHGWNQQRLCATRLKISADGETCLIESAA